MTSLRFTEAAVSANLSTSLKRKSFHHLTNIRDSRASHFTFLNYVNRKFAKSVWRPAHLDYYLTGHMFYHCILKSLTKITRSLLLFHLQLICQG